MPMYASSIYIYIYIHESVILPAIIDATPTGWTKYGSPDLRNWPSCIRSACMHVYACNYMLCMCLCVYVCVYVCIYIYIYIYIHIYMGGCVPCGVQVYAYSWISCSYVHSGMHVSTCIYIHTYANQIYISGTRKIMGLDYSICVCLCMILVNLANICMTYVHTCVHIITHTYLRNDIYMYIYIYTQNTYVNIHIHIHARLRKNLCGIYIKRYMHT